MTTTYRIPQLADLSGVPATTLRFYEDVGLLPADRTPAGYRRYGQEAVERLAFISSAKLLGLTLEEIRALLEVRGKGVCVPVRDRLLALLADRIARTDSRIAELRAFSALLARVRADLSGPAPDGACGPDCGCTVTAAPDAEAWRRMPVACTLDGAELDERIERWRALTARARRCEDIPDGVRLVFSADAGTAGEVAALAAAEQACCAFFDFTLHLAPDALRLEVRAPEKAADLLAGLFGAAG